MKPCAPRRAVSRGLVVIVALTAGCGGPAVPGGPGVSRTVIAPVQDEFDPLGFVVEHRSKLDLSDTQVSAVLSLRAELRAANRADLATLDSLDFALGGRLGSWLTEAQGGARPRRRWLPKMAPDQRDSFERLVGAIRGRGEAAECAMAEVLTSAQRDTLARLDGREHLALSRRDGARAMSDALTRGLGSCADPLPSLRPVPPRDRRIGTPDSGSSPRRRARPARPRFSPTLTLSSRRGPVAELAVSTSPSPRALA